MTKKIFPILFFLFFCSAKSYSQTATTDSTATIEKVYVDVGFLLNDYQRATQIKILHTEPNSEYWKNNADLLKAIKIKLPEYSQEILSGEWSDKTNSYQMHLTYDVKLKEIL